MPTTYTLKATGSASKTLLEEISEFINSIIDEFSILYEQDVHRDAILDVIEEFLEEYAKAGIITQFNIMCDGRNNNKAYTPEGVTNLHVSYKQDNCYVVTKLRYQITTTK